MPLFIVAIFLSAFLLFQVQPIVARYILPWYGGSPAVWTTCMLFFQIGLLAGYAYAHLLASAFREKPKMQLWIHLGVVVLALLFMPITPAEELRPTGGGDLVLNDRLNALRNLPATNAQLIDPEDASSVGFNKLTESRNAAIEIN